MTEINFKELWKSQKTETPVEATQIIAKARQLQRTTRRKIILTNILLFLTVIYIIGIVVYIEPEMLSTKIGALLVILAILMQILASGKMIPLLKEIHPETSTADYLKQLLLIKKKQAFLQTTVMGLYFILLGLGLLLYMYEYAIKLSLLGMSLTYGLSFGWMAIGWFYFRKRSVRKQLQKINEAIVGLESIENQFSEKE